MSQLRDALIAGNAQFVAEGWDQTDSDLEGRPRRALAVVACMDTRYNVEKVLGLEHGDAKIIRNAGNVVDDGTLRSLLVAVHAMGVRHICIMGHTKCGMTQIGHPNFPIAHGIAATTETPYHEAMRPDFQRWLGGFKDTKRHLQASLQLVASHPLLPKDLEVFGLLYDNDTGLVQPVD